MKKIKKFKNRKLYMVGESHYVTMEEVADHVRNGEEIEVKDYNGIDITAQTLMQVIGSREPLQGKTDLAFVRRVLQAGTLTAYAQGLEQKLGVAT